MDEQSQKITLLGSNVKIRNLPIKQVSLMEEGSLPAYGYNPGDHIELMAGDVSIEYGRLEQCLTWLAAYIAESDLNPRIHSVSYGEQKDIFQIFRKQSGAESERDDHGWFMVNQYLPAGARAKIAEPFRIDDDNREIFSNNNGLVVIDDSGCPPHLTEEDFARNPDAWVISMGISVAHWRHWAEMCGPRITLFCRLADLETTRMEMDCSVNWETIVAMCLRALRTEEVGLWDSVTRKFRCHIIVEMFPHGILYIGPDAIFFRHRKGCLPEKSSPRQRGSVPCYDTLILAMLAMDALRFGGFGFSRNYFYDFSQRVMHNWASLYQHGYYFKDTLEFPNLDFVKSYPGGYACSYVDNGPDPSFFELPALSTDFETVLDLVSSQIWSTQKKAALRKFFYLGKPSPMAQTTPLAGAYGYLDEIVAVLHDLKEEVNRKTGFHNLPIFNVGHLRTTDPAEIDPVITLQNVMDSYVSKESVQRPLCIGVFGPPGSGKSFAVRQVASVIAKKFQGNPFDLFEFNLTQFSSPEEINSAIEPVRAAVARGKVPIVFWDEFDCRYEGNEFGYLRYFLPSMQDGVTYVNGIPHYIGRAIFVFAGGVKASWEGMEKLLDADQPEMLEKMKTLKIPDFMSRLRVVLDIDGIEIPDDLLRDSASSAELEELRRVLLKRAFIIAHQMDTHWKKAARKTSGLLLRLLLGQYKFGARSIEAVIEASRASDRIVYGLPELIAPSAARIHAEWRVELERRIDQLRKNKGLRAVW
ncbi:MAG: AAA family ATPase [Proteobacteria bacterium]|nr:ATP-binding protein [Desulfocapsa sp.]MBU3946547.1 AAA family ATPase [Pseudomonadota bacterium]MBU3982388.1 AAA family ATPase [Pseudomonadota bacterium]MBU4028399.1 AAA family ATPase [Pseudomonadota bacterium]MBU4042708.1 AAA family ATPase [Pseudomonadota bacterium]